MQPVSERWKKEQRKQLVGESFVEITLSVGDPESQADASPSDNGGMYLSDSEKLTDGTFRSPTKYETLESNLWILDGQMQILPEEKPDKNEGYISEVLCDGMCVFSELVPTITISFSKTFSRLIPGLTIVWSNAYNEYASRFRVTAYNESIETFVEEYENNGDIVSVVSADIDNYDKIVIEILEWCLPYRRARIEEILVGIQRKFVKSDLIGYTHDIFVDPVSGELPKSEISFEVKNLNGEYNLDNPSGSTKYLMERQAVEVRYGYSLDGETEWIPAGTFYMSEWETPQNGITASFTARDAIEYMSDVFSGNLSGTLYEIAVSALEQAELPAMEDGSSRWIVDSSLSSVTVPNGVDLGGNVTVAEVLQYVANAGCCVLYQDRNGVVRIEPLVSEMTDYLIDRFVSYQNAEINLTKQLKAVDINNGQYVLSVGSSGETQPVVNPLISDNQAPVVAQWVADYLSKRQVLSGEFRADPRLDALDKITNINQFAEKTVLVTEVVYSYSGSFRGSYSGRAGL